jgi:predicted GNAT family N-acyltransferase
MIPKDAQLDITISRIDFTENAEEVRLIRRRVFIEEQRVPESEEWDEFDLHPETVHLLAQTASGSSAAYLRVVFLPDDQVKITRLAVYKAFRKKGIAHLLLKHAIKRALKNRPRSIFLNAQIDAISLYEKLGFVQEGVDFMEAGILHKKMRFQNAALESIYEDSVERLDSADAFVQHATQCLDLSHRQVLISSTELRKDIYEDAHFVEALSAFVRRDSKARVKILLSDSATLQQGNTGMLRLIRRLPSKIELRLLDKDTDAFEHFICCDRRHLIYFNDEQSLSGFCCYRSAPESQAIEEKFDHAWNQNSETDPNLRQFSI